MAHNAEVMGTLLRQALQDLHSPLIRTVRGKGLLNAIVIEHPNKEAAWDLCLLMMEGGLLAKPTHGDKIRFAPPLNITKGEVMEAVSIIGNALSSLH